MGATETSETKLRAENNINKGAYRSNKNVAT